MKNPIRKNARDLWCNACNFKQFHDTTKGSKGQETRGFRPRFDLDKDIIFITGWGNDKEKKIQTPTGRHHRNRGVPLPRGEPWKETEKEKANSGDDKEEQCQREGKKMPA